MNILTGLTSIRALLGATAVGLCLSVSPTVAQSSSTIKAVMQADLAILDPTFTTATITTDFGYMVYDTLFALDSKGEPKPQMVDRYEKSADLLTWTFTLREGLKWHDGTAVTAADAVASLKRWGAVDSLGKSLMATTEKMDALNDKSFQIILKKPFPLVLEALAKPSAYTPFIYQKAFAETPPSQAKHKVVGSGPFIFVDEEWRPGNRVVFRRNPNYVSRSEPQDGLAGGKVAKVERVEWIAIPDPNTAVAALQNGEIHFLDNPLMDFVPVLEDDPDITVYPVDKLGQTGMIRPNHLQKPFDNPKARQALVKLVKQSDFGAAMGVPKGHFIECYSYLGCNTPLENDTGAEAAKTQDIAEAKKLLAEAGYAGEKIVVMQPTDIAILNSSTQVLIQNLRNAGVNVDAQAMDWGTLVNRRNNKNTPAEGGWHLFITTNFTSNLASPITHSYLQASCDAATSPGWPCDKDLQALTDKFQGALSPEERKTTAAELNKAAYKSVPYASFGQMPILAAYRKELKGVQTSRLPVFFGVSLEK
ncbi:ABC transporter substrate-binding protein [Microvirga sp. BT689]|uniref:ABC transporter substrate-binding protein n=1 Tax=Microvirga arvi TaxID=2778731 RepID=UPI00194DE5BA|nr:ABC transporter substrate-binding protein [Microvirga arvi]MBM6583177.1 ABC transporter substrate-binding protein [Microvirga arvi]